MNKYLSDPDVSIIVPVYNAESTLARSVDSLLQQDLNDLEIILVDDASLDNSATIMQTLAKKCPRIKTIFKSNNSGVHEARRTGLQAATANWIGFMDADDYVEPEMFGSLLAAGKASESDIVICGVDRVTPSGDRLGIKFRFKEEQNLTHRVFERFCHHEFGTGSLWNKLYRRNLIMEHGSCRFRWRQDINEDTLVNIGCFRNASKVTTLPSIFYHYVASPDSTSAGNDRAKAVSDMLRAYGLAVEIYHHHGAETMKGIDILFRTQFSYPCYYLPDPSALYEHGQRLSEVMDILSVQHPAGLAAMVSYLGRPERTSALSLMEQWKDWKHSTIRLFYLFRSALSKRLRLMRRDVQL